MSFSAKRAMRCVSALSDLAVMGALMGAFTFTAAALPFVIVTESDCGSSSKNILISTPKS